MDTPVHGFSLTGVAPSNTATNYTFFTNQIANWNATETNRNQDISIGGVFKNLYVVATTAPGVGKSFQYTLMVNGVASALTCTMSDTATTASDNTNTVTVSATDKLSIRTVPTGTPTVPGNLSWSAIFSAGSNVSAIMAGTNGALSTGATSYGPMQGFNNGANFVSTEASISTVMPTAGTFSNFYIRSTTAPGAGKSYTYTLRKNGADTAVTATMSDAATTATDSTNSVTYAAGDTISIKAVPTGTPTAAVVRYGFQFSPTTDGESILLLGSTANTLNAGANYELLESGLNSWTATEANRTLTTQACTLQKLYVQLNTQPGAAKSYDFTVRKNVAGSAITTQISGTNTTGNDTVNTVSMAQGDSLSLEALPTGTPAVTIAKAGLVLYIAPTSSTITSDMWGVGTDQPYPDKTFVVSY